MTEVRVDGLKELRLALTKLIPAEVQGKVLQKALAKAVQPIVKDARARAPVDTGRLRRAIYSAPDKAAGTNSYQSRVVTVRRGKKYQKTDRDAYYWKFIEFGHRVGTKKTKYLRKAGRRSGGYGGQVKTIPARPFMRPAFETQKFKAVGIFRTAMAEQISKAATKAARNSPSFRQLRSASGL